MVFLICCPANGSYLTIERRLFPVLGRLQQRGIRLAKFIYKFNKELLSILYCQEKHSLMIDHNKHFEFSL
jgi:hypothetical protein